MALTIGDALLKLGVDASGLTKGLQDAQTQAKTAANNLVATAKQEADECEKYFEQLGKAKAEALKKVSIAAVAIGGAILGAAALAIKSYAEEEQSVSKLRQAMANMGLSYDDRKQAIESVIASQLKLGFSDEEQRDSLSRLILGTHDVAKAQDLMGMAMDIARGKGVDLASASQAVSQALAGNWRGLQQFVPAIKDAASEEEKWALARQAFAGQSEAYSKTLQGGMEALKVSMGELADTVGGLLAPAMKALVDFITPIITKVREWIEANPALAKVIGIATVAIGGLLLVLGTVGLLLPTLATGFAALGLVFTMATGPVGLIVMAIAGLVAAGIALWKNWDHIADFFSDLWYEIKKTFAEAIQAIIDYAIRPFLNVIADILDVGGSVVGFFNKDWGDAMKGAADKVRGTVDDTYAWCESLKTGRTELPKITTAIEDTTKALDDNAKATDRTKENIRRLQMGLPPLKEETKKVTEATDNLTDSTDSLGGAVVDTGGNLVDYSEAIEKLIPGLAKLKDAYTLEHSQLGILGLDYKDIFNALMDKGIAVDEISQKMAENNVLEGDAIGLARIYAGELGNLTQYSKEFGASIGEIIKQEEYQNSILGLLGITYDAAIVKAHLMGMETDEIGQKLLDAGVEAGDATGAVNALGETMLNFLTPTGAAKLSVDQLLQSISFLISTSDPMSLVFGQGAIQLGILTAALGAAQIAANNTAASVKELTAAQIAQNALTVAQAATPQGAGGVGVSISPEIAALAALYDINTEIGLTADQIIASATSIQAFQDQQAAGQAAAAAAYAVNAAAFAASFPGLAVPPPPTYATGGIIPEPTLLYGMKSQRAYAIAGEAGPERVSPMGTGGGGNNTNNFNIASLVVREQADVERIAQELYRLERLRGFAYGRS